MGSRKSKGKTNAKIRTITLFPAGIAKGEKPSISKDLLPEKWVYSLPHFRQYQPVTKQFTHSWVPGHYNKYFQKVKCLAKIAAKQQLFGVKYCVFYVNPNTKYTVSRHFSTLCLVDLVTFVDITLQIM